MPTNPLKRFIEKCNFSKLANYLKKHDNGNELVNDEIVDQAFDKFLHSDNKNIVNAYSIINAITPYAKKDKVQERQKSSEYKLKYTEYVEHRSSRDISKALDDSIEKKLVFPIKYPDNTSFVRRLLHIPSKQKDADVVKNFTEKLPGLIAKLRDDILDDKKFQDTNGNCILSPERLNFLIYQRISLKAQKQLNLEPSITDNVFSAVNDLALSNTINNKISSVIKGQKMSDEDIREELGDITRAVQRLTPPHLATWSNMLVVGMEDSYKSLEAKSFRLGVSAIVQNHMHILARDGEALFKNGLCKESKEMFRSAYIIADNLHSNLRPEYERKLQEVQIEFYKQLNEAMSSKNHLPKNALCSFEKEGIRLLSEELHHSRMTTLSCNRIEGEFLKNFIEYAMENKEFNKRMQRVRDQDTVYSKEKRYALATCSKFSYKTQELDRVSHVNDTLDMFLKLRARNGGTLNVPEDQKISLYDLGALERFSSTSVGNVLKVLKKCQAKIANDPFVDASVASDNPRLKKLLDLYDKSVPLLDNLKQEISKDTSMKDGDLIVDVASKYHALEHHSRDICDVLQDMFTRYSHAAIGMEDQSLREIQGQYIDDKVDMLHSLVTDTFRIYPDRLISNDTLHSMAQSLSRTDDEFRSSICKEYNNIIRKIGSKEELGALNVDNTLERRARAGIADVIPLGHHGKTAVKTWASKALDKKGNDSKMTIDRILNDETDDMICSEFAAKITILALVALEKKLTAEIKEKDPKFDIPHEGFIKLPFNKDEDLSKVSPERLVKQLKLVNAIEPVSKVGIAKEIVRGI